MAAHVFHRQVRNFETCQCSKGHLGCMHHCAVLSVLAKSGYYGCILCSLESYSALMNEATDILLMKLAAAAKETRVIDLYKLIGDMTLQVVGTTAFGCAPFNSLWIEVRTAGHGLSDIAVGNSSPKCIEFNLFAGLSSTLRIWTVQTRKWEWRSRKQHST